MARIKYIGSTLGGAASGPRISFSLPDPELISVPAIGEAAAEFKRLEDVVRDSYAALQAAEVKAEEANLADTVARQTAIREGKPVTKPRARSAPAQEALADAQAVYADTVAVRDAAADRLVEVVRDQAEAIRGRVAEISVPMLERLSVLMAEAAPLRAALTGLREWTELEFTEASWSQGARLGPPGTTAYTTTEGVTSDE